MDFAIIQLVNYLRISHLQKNFHTLEMNVENNQFILQKLIYPSYGIDEPQLYYRFTGNGVYLENETIIISPQTIADFGTYFNSFSIEKWSAYTKIKEYGLSLEIEGNCTLQLYHAYLEGGTVVTDDLEKTEIKNSSFSTTELEIPCFDKGIISFRIQTTDSPVKIREAYYYSENVKTRDISLALAFTTYKREAYITENVRRILDAESLPIHIFIADNSGTLNLDSDPRVTILKNHNSGGAGGFARNMMEIIKAESSYSHIVLMDDDVSIDPRIFDRLIRFLSAVDQEHASSFIGGAMFRRDYKYFHVESGAKWKGTVIWRFGHGMDMRRLDCVLHTNSIHKEDYNAWWFCCIPIGYIRNDNLPLPVFFQWDDIDYGIRNKAPLILMNGICIWHDAFETKRSAMYTYYSMRNPLIVNSCHKGGYSKHKVLKQLKYRIRAELGLYRYEHAEALIKAMEDYLRGPMWLCNINADEYNKTILALNKPVSYVADQVDYQWYLVGCQIMDCDFLHKLVRKLSLNGYLLKANREIMLPLYADRAVQGYRAKRILFYEENTGNGYWTEKDFGKAVSLWFRFHKQLFRMRINYSGLVKEYRRDYSYLTSGEMWEKYLKM